MNNQEAFDVMVRHAREQGVKALNGERKCRYRGNGGTKCFVGALIPDAEYTVMLEGKPAISLSRMLPCLHGLTADFLDYMQAIHDRDAVSTWEQCFANAAHVFGLTLPPLESEASHA